MRQIQTEIPTQIMVKQVNTGWVKSSYQFSTDGNTMGQLDYAKSYLKKATASIDGKEFSIRRTGFWKFYIEISSTTNQQYNMKLDINWRNKLKITDSEGNPFVFKTANMWKSRWAWFDRYERPLIEIKSNNFSWKNRGVIDIKYPEMKDCLFWIMVSWFVILSAEADASAMAGI